MNVKTAFINGSIDSEIFMTQLEGYVDAYKPNYVCKLNKSIYGLKQSARCWNSTLDQHLKSSGYRKINAGGCIYIKLIKKPDGHICFFVLAVYVVAATILDSGSFSSLNNASQLRLWKLLQNHFLFLMKANFVLSSL